jgi:lipoate-protein ligase A
MAVDEALLEAVNTLARPVLRFYGWAESAATFGYSQRWNDVSQWTPLRPLIRRPTGGGLVPHADDWTYSLAFPRSDHWACTKAVESYRQLHEWVHRALASLGVPTSLAEAESKPAPGQCFVGAEKFDLLRKGVKLAGAAQRRNRHGLLIQGSIQPGTAPCPRTDWQQAMQETALFPTRVQWAELRLDEAFGDRASRLASEKYSQPAYNVRR